MPEGIAAEPTCSITTKLMSCVGLILLRVRDAQIMHASSVSRVLVSSGARQLSVSAVAMATEGSRQFETLEVTRPSEWVIQVQLDRPEKSNAMNIAFFR